MKFLEHKTNDVIAPIQNENGVVLVSAMLILLLLSFMAATMTDTTITDKKMVRSEAIFKKAFYHAESAAFEGVQKMENVPYAQGPFQLLAPIVDTSSDFYDLLIIGDTDEPGNLKVSLEKNLLHNPASDPAEITGDWLTSHNSLTLTETIDQDQDSRRLIVQQPIPTGSSLVLGQSRLYAYNAYGLSESLGGRALIRLGYKKRF